MSKGLCDFFLFVCFATSTTLLTHTHTHRYDQDQEDHVRHMFRQVKTERGRGVVLEVESEGACLRFCACVEFFYVPSHIMQL
jgi:hypothetical protein